jgi:hypothetical protein
VYLDVEPIACGGDIADDGAAGCEACSALSFDDYIVLRARCGEVDGPAGVGQLAEHEFAEGGRRKAALARGLDQRAGDATAVRRPPYAGARSPR